MWHSDKRDKNCANNDVSIHCVGHFIHILPEVS